MNIDKIRTVWYSVDCIEHALREELRHHYSSILMDTDEDHPMKCDIACAFGGFGLSSLEMPHCIGVWQHPTEGWIYFNFDDNGAPTDFDDMPITELIEILEILI